MKILPRSGLQRQMLFYIVFIGIVFLTMAVEMTLFLGKERVLGALGAGHGGAEVLETVRLIQLKVGVMLLNLLLSIGLVMLLFTKRIMIPLGQVIETTRAISEGDLSATVPIHGQDEFGELSGRINELAANYQELILLCRSMTGQAREALRDCDGKCGIDGAMEVLDDLDQTLGEFGRSFYGGE